MSGSAKKLFDILELTVYVADSLSQGDLAACCLVSQSWLTTFSPHLWHTIIIRQHDAIPKFQSPEGSAGLVRNGHHIRVIRTYSIESLGPIVEFGNTCRNLVVLDTEYRPDAERTESAAAEAEMAAKARNKDRQMLVLVLERNSRLEFLIVPQHCLESEAFIRVAVEGLPLLKELFSTSKSRLLCDPAKFQVTDHRRWPRFSTCIPSFGSRQQQQEAKVRAEHDEKWYVKQMETVFVDGHRGFLFDPDLTVSKTYESHPRLKDLELNMVKSINQTALRKIRNTDENLTCLEIWHGSAATVTQTLLEVPQGLLTSITLANLNYSHRYYVNEPVEKIGRAGLLKHTPTLENLFARGCSIEGRDIEDLLCTSPRLKTLELIQEDTILNVIVDTELDIQDAVTAPWICAGLEVFECRISGVPRPDVIYDFYYYERSFAPYPPIPPCPKELTVEPPTPQHTIENDSHTLQRNFLRQLGRLTHLRVLSLGSNYPPYESRESFSLVLKGIRTMIVSEKVQHQCLELTLESGLDELAELKELEELNVYQMAHRIGIVEVKWMVEQWPKLKALRGLVCPDYNKRFEIDYEAMILSMEHVPGANEEEEVEVEEPEHIVWLKKHRPDIEL
ncbi:hypothetical protein EC991_001478 [Linnemannia zychae]|nr:hypothetical protein EC991_001478 [Linnemannia zychae]